MQKIFVGKAKRQENTQKSRPSVTKIPFTEDEKRDLALFFLRAKAKRDFIKEMGVAESTLYNALKSWTATRRFRKQVLDYISSHSKK